MVDNNLRDYSLYRRLILLILTSDINSIELVQYILKTIQRNS